MKATSEKRVCKRIAASQRTAALEEVATEVDLLRGLDHPHIIRVFEFYQASEHVDIIMEPVFGGTMTSLVNGLYMGPNNEAVGRPESLSEWWLATALGQILSALAYAHDVAGVVHKDLKTDNVLMVGPVDLSAEEQLKKPVHAMLADFGIAEVFSPLVRAVLPSDSTVSGTMPQRITRSGSGRGRSSRVGGTPTYMSPEMFQGSFTEKCDLWSLGVVAFQLMTGELPYKADNLLMQANIVCCPRRHPRWELLTKLSWGLGARWFCQQLLTKDEAMRPSATEALKSEWLIQAKASRQEEIALPGGERDALQTQHLQSHLMKLAMHCIVSQLNLSQMHHLNLRFKKYDTTGDGRLSHVEMRQVLDDVGFTSNEDKDLVIESLDTDRSGKVDYSEFIAGCLDLGHGAMRKQLRVAFDIFDLDGSGSISTNELRQVLTQGPNDRTPPMRLPSSATGTHSMPVGFGSLLPDGMTVKEVMTGLDVDKTGQVSFSEFEAYLLDEHERNGKRLHGEPEEGEEDSDELLP